MIYENKYTINLQTEILGDSKSEMSNITILFGKSFTQKWQINTQLNISEF